MIGKGSVQPSMTTLLPDVRGLPAILHMIFAPNVRSFFHSISAKDLKFNLKDSNR